MVDLNAHRVVVAQVLEGVAHDRQLEMGLEDAYRFTTEVIVDNALGQDFEEGLAAFLEKRSPAWPNGGR